MDEDKIINAILNLSEGINRIQSEMLTKSDGQQIQDILESHTTIMKNIQEDHTFAIEWIKKLQDTVDKQAEEIHVLKTKLKMA